MTDEAGGPSTPTGANAQQKLKGKKNVTSASSTSTLAVSIDAMISRLMFDDSVDGGASELLRNAGIDPPDANALKAIQEAQSKYRDKFLNAHAEYCETFLTNLEDDESIKGLATNGDWDGLAIARHETGLCAVFLLLGLMGHFHELWISLVYNCISCDLKKESQSLTDGANEILVRETVSMMDKYSLALRGFDIETGSTTRALGNILGRKEKATLRKAVNDKTLVPLIQGLFKQHMMQKKSKDGASGNSIKSEYCQIHCDFLLVFIELTNRGFLYKNALVELEDNAIGKTADDAKAEATKHRATFRSVLRILLQHFDVVESEQPSAPAFLRRISGSGSTLFRSQSGSSDDGSRSLSIRKRLSRKLTGRGLDSDGSQGSLGLRKEKGKKKTGKEKKDA